MEGTLYGGRRRRRFAALVQPGAGHCCDLNGVFVVDCVICRRCKWREKILIERQTRAVVAEVEASKCVLLLPCCAMVISNMYPEPSKDGLREHVFYPNPIGFESRKLHPHERQHVLGLLHVQHT